MGVVFIELTSSSQGLVERLLIRRTQKKVAEKFGIQLELEIELLGNWQDLEAEDKAAKKPSQRKQSKK